MVRREMRRRRRDGRRRVFENEARRQRDFMRSGERERVFGCAHRDEVVLRGGRGGGRCVCARDRRVCNRDGQGGELLVDLHRLLVSCTVQQLGSQSGKGERNAHLFVAELLGKASRVRSPALLLPFAEPPDADADEREHDEDDHEDNPPP